MPTTIQERIDFFLTNEVWLNTKTSNWNVLFKLITKTMANRLKIVLLDIIDENQSAFIPNRLITNNAIVAFECFHAMKERKREELEIWPLNWICQRHMIE